MASGTTKWVSEGRLEVVLGDLAAPQRLGMSEQVYAKLADEVDDILHNGLLSTGSTLTASCVLPTWARPSAPSSSATPVRRPKTLTFVSSTSALDTDHYIHLSRLDPARSGPIAGWHCSSASRVPETDDLEANTRVSPLAMASPSGLPRS